MDFSATVLLACLGAAAIFLVPFWVSRRTTDPTIRSPVDPISGAKDQAATYNIETSFISMPDDLKTRDEMVMWLVQELPKLTSRLHEGRME